MSNITNKMKKKKLGWITILCRLQKSVCLFNVMNECNKTDCPWAVFIELVQPVVSKEELFIHFASIVFL